MKKLFPLLYFLFFVPFVAFTQVQWASKVLGVSSECPLGNQGQYMAKQVIGKPSKLPQAESGGTAWRTKSEDGGEEWIKVGFDNPLNVRQIAIAQNYKPGCVTKIILSDNQGNEQVISTFNPALLTKPLLLINLPIATKFKVSSLQLFLNTKKVKGWNEIDAIGISENNLPIKASINLVAGVPAKLKAENLGINVNSGTNEVAPVISPDGKTLYFTRFDHPKNTRSKEDYDVWFSEFINEKWQEAKNIGKPINNWGVNSITYISPDDRTALLMNFYMPDGTLRKGVSMSRKDNTGWTFPKNVIIKNYDSFGTESVAGFYIGPSGNTMILSFQDKNSMGNDDLYITFRQPDDTWSEPKNLGNSINSADNERTPFLATDNKTLYFTSDGHSGYGGMDIFLSRRLDDTWLNWSEPENLGPAFNSIEDEAHFTIPASGNYAYFCSANNAIGLFDIFKIELPEPLRPIPTAIVKGIVLDQSTKKPIEAEVVIEDLDKKLPAQNINFDPSVGEFKLVVNLEKQYGLTAKKQGYQSASTVIDLSNEKKYQEITKEILLAPIEVGQKITLNALLFKQSLAELLPTSIPELERLKETMIQNPNLEILLEGHTDNQGDFDENLKLSKARVEEVKKYLTTNGIAQNRIQTKGLGSTQPVSSNYQELTRKNNRRVELTILKK